MSAPRLPLADGRLGDANLRGQRLLGQLASDSRGPDRGGVVFVHGGSVANGNRESQCLGNDKLSAGGDPSGMDSFGRKLRKLREARELSQEQLGFSLAVTKATVSKWENDRSEPNLRQLRGLRRIFRDYIRSLDELIVEDEQLPVDGAKHLRDQPPPAYGDPRQIASMEEMMLLARFRALTGKRRRGLLDLLSEETAASSERK